MAKLNKNYPKRVAFPKGEQKKFIELIKDKLDLNLKELANLAGVHIRSLTDWKREKLSMSLPAFERFCVEAKLSKPVGIKIKEPFWYISKGWLKGWLAVKKKYGGRVPVDEEYRKKKWYEWWEREGRYRKHPLIGITKPIKKPELSENLAEFVGIVMGDGGITKNQITITLHAFDDEEYQKFVVNIITKLFGIKPAIYKNKISPVNRISVSRTELVKFCNEELGLKIGNKVKQNFDIPDWIKKSKEFQIACIRGLVDTDGCVFTHNYKVNGKWYSYKKLCFTSYSKPLLESVYLILKDLGLKPRKAYFRDIRLDSIEDIKRYFEVIGSSNPKHLKRYIN